MTPSPLEGVEQRAREAAKRKDHVGMHPLDSFVTGYLAASATEPLRFAIEELETALANGEIWPNPYQGEEAQTEIVYASILRDALARLRAELTEAER